MPSSSVLGTSAVFRDTVVLVICLGLSCLSLGCASAAAASITIAAGDQALPAGPMSWMPKTPLDSAKPVYALVDGDKKIPAQSDADGRLWWWSEPMPAGKAITYTVQPGKAEDRVVLTKDGDEVIKINVDGKLFTALNFKKTEPRVYLYPLIAPTGDPVTRDWPMKDNPLEKDNKRQDHPHHRSLWCAHGDIRTENFDKPGHDFWAERQGKPQACQALKRIAHMVSGPAFGRVEAEIEWMTADGRRLFTEHRTYTFFAGNGEARMIDARNVFKFTDGDVMFADTKEGGIIALRLAVTMDEVGVKEPRALHGQMTNSQGGVTAKECWGKPAEWCDYVGPVNDKQLGIAVFDHPRNFRHPTTWHIRDYGLYTANPFGLSNFTNDKKQNGSKTWKKGESAEFNYRVLIHQGDTKSAAIAGQYKLYTNPPTVSAK